MKDKKKSFFNRFTALVSIILIVVIALCARLVLLQVVNANNYKIQANTKAHKFIKEVAARGEITDSQGKKLATNSQSYNITYMETDDNKKIFYTTMAKVFYLLDQYGENKNDDFPLKVTPTYSFDFNATDEQEIKAAQIRFLNERGGFKDNIIKNLNLKVNDNKLTQAQKNIVNKYLLKISPKYAFNKLEKLYKIPDSYSFTIDGKTISKKCTLEDKRKFMLEKDAVQAQSYSGYKPVTIASNIKRDTAIAFLQKLNELPGIDVEEVPIRNYPYGKLASNAIGYIGKITTSSDNETDAYTERGYDVDSDLIGISGLEAAEEDRLKGTAGGKVVEVNKSGRVTNEFASKDPYPGQTLKTTINADVQYTAEQALQKAMNSIRAGATDDGKSGSYTGNATRGATVAMNMTGGVLALAQSPNFNPNDFASPNGLSDEARKKYFPSVEDQIKNLNLPSDLIDKLFPVDKGTGKRTDAYDYLPKPMYNYATMGLTPPGSTFKLLTAIAGLETKTIDPSFTIEDNGHYDDGHNDKRTFNSDGALGTLNLVLGIARSSNPYFMTVSEMIRKAFGYDKLAEYAWKFGLGVQPNSGVNPSTGIEIKENFGQTFNTYSKKSSLGQQASWTIMDALINKTYAKKVQAIDLHTNSSDSDSIANLKADIKQKIKGYVINGKFNKEEFCNILNKFAQSSGIVISDSDMSAIASGAKAVVDNAVASATIPANIHSAAIGQGDDNYTTLQLANYVATIANGGKRYKVHLTDQITDPVTNSVMFKYTPQVIKDTGVSKYTLDTVKRGMALVNTEGTAKGKFDGLPFTTAGKTGTADAFSIPFQEEIKRSSYAVYIGFAPVDNPKIAVATVIYDGGFGNQVTDVARAIYESYFKNVEKMSGVPQDVITDTTAKPETDDVQSNNASSR